MIFRDFEAVLAALEQGFGRSRVLVVGDLILDRYLWGEVKRISPEAPVPVVRVLRESESAGGAANVAANLRGLGLAVTLIGVTGRDSAQAALRARLEVLGIESELIALAERGTITKTRIIGDHQQMLRIDAEQTGPLDPADREQLIATAQRQLEGGEVAALLLSDYAKGVLDEALCQALIECANRRQIPVLIDPKGRDFSRYHGAELITPNRAELAQATGASASDLDALYSAARDLVDELELERLVLTLSEHGMSLIDRREIVHVPAVAKEVFDVSGAGDTVIATITAARVASLDPVDAAHLANLAAGVVVAKVGTVAIQREELLQAMLGESGGNQAAKICELEALQQRIAGWRAAGERIVFTNGCFDLLHVGHVTYLERARRHGQRLVLGLNSDRSVAELKGASRPVIGEADRARVLAALAAVDAIILFDSSTPLALIKALRPDVLVKGADYSEEQVVGAKEVKSWGGRVVLVPLVADRSTSGIIERMSRGADPEH